MATLAPGAAKHLVVLAWHPPAAQHRGQEGGPAAVGCWVSSAGAGGVLQAGTEVTPKPGESQRLCPSVSSRPQRVRAGLAINTAELGDRGLKAFNDSVAFQKSSSRRLTQGRVLLCVPWHLTEGPCHPPQEPGEEVGWQ